MKQVTITTDGGCFPNPGRGGWAAILRYGSAYREISGSDESTTNNRMEFRALIEAVKLLKEPCEVLVRTDSRNTIAWASQGAFRRHKQRRIQPVAYAMNQEWRQVSAKHRITFEWVRGHNGDPDNERCDLLAQDQIRRPF